MSAGFSLRLAFGFKFGILSMSFKLLSTNAIWMDNRGIILDEEMETVKKMNVFTFETDSQILLLGEMTKSG